MKVVRVGSGNNKEVPPKKKPQDGGTPESAGSGENAKKPTSGRGVLPRRSVTSTPGVIPKRKGNSGEGTDGRGAKSSVPKKAKAVDGSGVSREGKRKAEAVRGLLRGYPLPGEPKKVNPRKLRWWLSPAEAWVKAGRKLDKRGMAGEMPMGVPMGNWSKLEGWKMEPLESELRRLRPEVAIPRLRNMRWEKPKRVYTRKQKVVAGVLAVSLIGGVGSFEFYTKVAKPAQEKVLEAKTGTFALRQYESAVRGGNFKELGSLVEKSYLSQEEGYANSNKHRLEFLKAMMGTVKYDVFVEEAKDINGKVFYDKPVWSSEKKPVMIPGTLRGGEEVEVTYVDYASIKPEIKKIQSMMKEAKFGPDDVDYRNKMIDLFCDYLVGLAKEGNLPTKTEKRKPELIKKESGVYAVDLAEDAKIDGVLFSGEDFWDLQTRFWVAAAGLKKNPAWDQWNAMTPEQKAALVEPPKKVENPEWSAWNALPPDQKAGKPEPGKEIDNPAWAQWNAIPQEQKVLAVEPPKEIQVIEVNPEWVKWNKEHGITDEGNGGNEGKEGVEGEKKGLSDDGQGRLEEMKKELEVGAGGKEAGKSDESKDSGGKDGVEKKDKKKGPTSKVDSGISVGEDAKKSEKEKVPEKYVGSDKWMGKTWCGVWYIQTVLAKGEDGDTSSSYTGPLVGDGSKENPASVNTPVITNLLMDVPENGTTVLKKFPIKVTLLWIDQGQPAIDFIESKDVRNKGFLPISKVKILGMKFKVENLSKQELTIPDNSTLADSNANVLGRAGKVFSLKRSVKLKPGEVGVIESWANSPDLDNQYLIWGNDFKRRDNPVWFRVLGAKEGKVKEGYVIDKESQMVGEDGMPLDKSALDGGSKNQATDILQQAECKEGVDQAKCEEAQRENRAKRESSEDKNKDKK